MNFRVKKGSYTNLFSMVFSVSKAEIKKFFFWQDKIINYSELFLCLSSSSSNRERGFHIVSIPLNKQGWNEYVIRKREDDFTMSVLFVCHLLTLYLFSSFFFFLYPFGLLKSGAADFLCLDAPHFGVFISNTAFVFGFEPALTEKRLLK